MRTADRQIGGKNLTKEIGVNIPKKSLKPPPSSHITGYLHGFAMKRMKTQLKNMLMLLKMDRFLR